MALPLDQHFGSKFVFLCFYCVKFNGIYRSGYGGHSNFKALEADSRQSLRIPSEQRLCVQPAATTVRPATSLKECVDFVCFLLPTTALMLVSC